jgi:hypothetical protein
MPVFKAIGLRYEIDDLHIAVRWIAALIQETAL